MEAARREGIDAVQFQSSAQIEEELRHQYSLSYTPDKAESGYHKLHLSTRNGDLTVQTRPGYYAD